MLQEAGIMDSDIIEEPGTHPLSSPEDWWLVAMGSGYRGTISQLNASSFMKVRETNLAAIKDISAITTNVIYSVSKK